MEQARVSAIITAFNGEPFIAAAIESVLGQTRPVDEIVVVDDGSTDGTAAIVERYRSRGVRLVCQENRGISEARNRGIAETTGNLIAFLDCDDLWVPEKSERQIQHLLDKPEVGLITCDPWWWDIQTNQCEVRPLRPGNTQSAIRRKLAIRNYLGNASGIVVRRSALDAVGVFDPAEIYAEDWEMWRRIASRFDVSIVRSPLMVYRANPYSLTHQRLGERPDGYYALARRAIRSEKALWRPLLLLHALAWREYFKTIYARDQNRRWQYVLHALASFLCWPIEETSGKLRLIARALLGERIFTVYKSLARPTPPRAPVFSLKGSASGSTEGHPPGWR